MMSLPGKATNWREFLDKLPKTWNDFCERYKPPTNWIDFYEGHFLSPFYWVDKNSEQYLTFLVNLEGPLHPDFDEARLALHADGKRLVINYANGGSLP